MENWFTDVGRPALFEALTAACDQVGDDLNRKVLELTGNNARLQAELESLKTSAASAERLQTENRLLREEIQGLKVANEKSRSKKDASTIRENTTPTPSPRRSARTPLAPRSTNEPIPLKKSSKHERSDLSKLTLPELKEEYLRLGGNYDKLHEKYLETLNARNALDQRLREKIKNVDQWTTHAEELRTQSEKRLQKVKRLEAQLASVGGNTVGFTASFSPDASDNVPPTTGQKSHVSHPEATSHSAPSGKPGIQSVHDVRESDHEPIGIGVGQVPFICRQDSGESTEVSTQGNSHEDEAQVLPPLPDDRNGLQKMVAIKQEPSSDTPVVVSERCVRKRRREDDDIEHIPARVKTEDSDEPLVHEERRAFAPQESMDFDAEMPHVQTPRKTRLRQLEEEDEDMDRDEYRIQQNNSARSNLRNYQQAQVSRQQQISSKAKSASPSSIEQGIDSLAEDDDQCQTSRTSKPSRGEPRPSKALKRLLDSPSAEQATTSPSTTTTRAEAVPRSAPRLASTDFYLQIPPARELPFGKGGSRKPNESLQQRAKSPPVVASPLKRTTTPANTNQSKRSKQGGGSGSGSGSDSENMSPPPVPTTRATTTTTTNANINNSRRTSGAAAKDRTPLRERALSQLQLADFRVNPATNAGYGYAFADVVRDQGERATALVGCVRESCCGPQFRALARAEQPTEGPVAFRSLLEQHLGEAEAARRLPGMSREDQEQLWLEAKTQQLANAHGRCRHRYQRMPDPPGFWRTDFPSTQELEADQAEGARMEAEIVRERYREAMKGGRWLFRDEVPTAGSHQGQ